MQDLRFSLFIYMSESDCKRDKDEREERKKMKKKEIEDK